MVACGWKGVGKSLFGLPKVMGAEVVVLVVVVVVVVLGSGMVMGAQYTVGDSIGWGLGNDLQSWSTQFKFQVGDELYFPYPEGQHSVLLVKEEDYNSCNTESPVSSDNGSGDMAITLATAETYYFICGVPGHCAQGLKLTIQVEPGPDDGDHQLPPPPPADEAITDQHPPPDHAPPAAEDMAPPQAPHDVAAPATSTLSPPYYSKFNTFHRMNAAAGLDRAILASSAALAAISSLLFFLL